MLTWLQRRIRKNLYTKLVKLNLNFTSSSQLNIMLCVMKGVYRWISGSGIFIFVSALLLYHLTIIFLAMYLSWTDVLVTAFQYRALLYTLTLVFLSVLLIVIFVGLSAEWLRAWSSSNDQLLRPHYRRDEYEGMDSR